MQANGLSIPQDIFLPVMREKRHGQCKRKKRSTHAHAGTERGLNVRTIGQLRGAFTSRRFVYFVATCQLSCSQFVFLSFVFSFFSNYFYRAWSCVLSILLVHWFFLSSFFFFFFFQALNPHPCDRISKQRGVYVSTLLRTFFFFLFNLLLMTN